MPGMFKIPVWLAGPLILLGIAWVGIGWAFDVGLWIIGLAFAAIYALIVSRRQVSITLEPWSKERGMVLWSYRTNQRPSVEPRLVWDDAPPEQQAPEATPAVTEAPPMPAEQVGDLRRHEPEDRADANPD